MNTNINEQPVEPTDTQETPQAPSVPLVIDITPPAATQQAEINFDPYYAEYQSAGKLSDESYQALRDKGLPKAFVDQYIDGQRALAELHAEKAYAVVGGKNEFAKIAEWAKVNLSQQELAAFNAGVMGNVYQMQLAVQGLQAKYAAHSGSAPNLLSGSGGASGITQGGFKSTFEMVTAINDPRYKHDPAYRNDVARRISLTN